MISKIKKITVVFIFIFSPIVINTATAGMGGHPLPCGFPYPPCPVPLDNGIIFLLIAGAIYGGIKIYFSKKNPA